MFTGIITDIGTVELVSRRGDTTFKIRTAYDPAGISIGASIACSGACLTVIAKGGQAGDAWFSAEASAETLSKTTLGDWQPGHAVNLERSLRVGDDNRSIRIKWLPVGTSQPAFAGYQLIRYQGDNLLDSAIIYTASTIFDTAFVDTDASLRPDSLGYCYRVEARDKCGNRTRTAVYCSLVLQSAAAGDTTAWWNSSAASPRQASAGAWAWTPRATRANTDPSDVAADPSGPRTYPRPCRRRWAPRARPRRRQARALAGRS